MSQHRVIIDTDPGIDDAQAIAFALAHPQIDLLGLTTVYGNADVDSTTRNALQVLSVFGHPQVPVARGADVPLQQPRMAAPDFVHGSDGMGNLDLPTPDNSAVALSAAEFIVEQANATPGEISLVAIGPLTNIALALQLDPELAGKLKELIIMGGTIDEPGNVSPLAEANLINDPHAADLVVGQDWPLSVIGLDVTLKILLNDHHLAEIRNSAGASGQFLWDSSRFYVDFYTSRMASNGTLPRDHVPACAMHDASALVYLVARDAFTMASGGARVISEGIAIGQLALDRRGDDYFVDAWQDRPKIYAAMQVDADRVRQHFIDTLTASDSGLA